MRHSDQPSGDRSEGSCYRYRLSRNSAAFDFLAIRRLLMSTFFERAPARRMSNQRIPIDIRRFA